MLMEDATRQKIWTREISLREEGAKDVEISRRAGFISYGGREQQ